MQLTTRSIRPVLETPTCQVPCERKAKEGRSPGSASWMSHQGDASKGDSGGGGLPYCLLGVVCPSVTIRALDNAVGRSHVAQAGQKLAIQLRMALNT